MWGRKKNETVKDLEQWNQTTRAVSNSGDRTDCKVSGRIVLSCRIVKRRHWYVFGLWHRETLHPREHRNRNLFCYFVATVLWPKFLCFDYSPPFVTGCPDSRKSARWTKYWLEHNDLAQVQPALVVQAIAHIHESTANAKSNVPFEKFQWFRRRDKTIVAKQANILKWTFPIFRN